VVLLYMDRILKVEKKSGNLIINEIS
jgi:hypothetical protein